MSIRTCLMLLLMLPALAQADEVAIYRCTDAAGTLTLQNMPCPKGMRQEKKMMQSVNTVPLSPAPMHGAAVGPRATAAPARSDAVPAQPVADAPAAASGERLPPPNLFQCTTRDSGSYVTEDSEPASRCVTLRTTGLDGNPQGGAGNACEVVRDQCARVPDEALCEAWKKKRDEAEVAWRFTRPDTEAKNRAAFERVQRILSESTCAGR